MEKKYFYIEKIMEVEESNFITYYKLFETNEKYDDEADQLYEVFSEYKNIVKYIVENLEDYEEFKGDFEVLDLDAEGHAYFENGKCVRIDSHWGFNDDFLKEHWMGIEKDEDDYEPSCTSCGDGGCIHCEPHRFI